MSTSISIDTTGPLRPLYICGPTASGKTALSLQFARDFEGEIINLDAYQVYQDIEILSAAPSLVERQSLPHHLFSVLHPSREHDAQNHREMALESMEEIQSRGKLPILVGGSGMYLKFLSHGPSPVPASDPALREMLETKSDTELVTQLTDLDPKGAEMTNLQNRRYVIRALEICLLAKRPMSSIKTEWKQTSLEQEKHLRGIVIAWDRELLRERISQRTDQMLHAGVIEEVRQLENVSTTCERAIGLREIRAHLSDELELTALRDKIFFATCQYAKRQRTWFHKEKWLTKLDPDHPMPEAQLHAELDLH